MNSINRRIGRDLVPLMLLFFSAVSMQAESIAPVKLDVLFKEAHLVAVVNILSGDSEHYPITVYKAEVTEAFKGTNPGERIYIGPYIGLGVGTDYLLFLSKSEKQLTPKVMAFGFTYGDLGYYYSIMYSGYSSLEVDYACVFGGTEASQTCDYGVVLNPDQVILPDIIKTYPSGEADATTNYKKWVRRDEIISVLEQMKTANKATSPSK